MDNTKSKNKDKIAIIGISCRFPDAENIDDFWRNLISKKESVVHFQDAELETNDHLLNNSNFIKAGSFVDNIEYFDADFFGIGAKEAEMMDPQQRIFMECCWEALESSGYAKINQKQNIGVFSSCGINSYLINNVNQSIGYVKNRNFLSNSNDFQVMMGNDRDYLSTKVSYRFNLTGPSMDIQTACSSSLVAIHEACKAIRGGECDMALVGSASIMVPQKAGYLHEEDMISSSDGHCRPFDNNATGTVFGNGAASVILKKLADAERDGDIIYATIDGSAVNNDGKEKVGYSAPSINAQIDVLQKALADADLKPKDINYIEAHGTGTKLGDPIEVRAIQKVFLNSAKKCGIGSVKGNIGHLGWASGMAGLIKSVLILKYKIIPASINFESLNENISIGEKDSVYICDKNIDLSSKCNSPLHVGVSAFGLGGTNAHIILGSYSEKEAHADVTNGEIFILKTSAQTKKSLVLLLEDHLKHLLLLDNKDLPHYCYTNNVFKGDYKYRDLIFGKNKKVLIQKIQNIISESNNQQKLSATDSSHSKVAFVFAGQGSQKHKSTLELYNNNRFFREGIEECEALYRKSTGKSLKDILYGTDENIIDNTEYTQPAIFAVEYALCKLWDYLGIMPDYVLGHSLGEYTAAYMAKVLSLEEVFNLVIKRGELSTTISSPGSMLVIFSNLDFVVENIKEYKNVSIAAINSSQNIVVSGLEDQVDLLTKKLEKGGIKYKKLNISSAFHSSLIEQIIPEFTKYVKGLHFQNPTVSFVSNLTGGKADFDVTDPYYWVKHIRNTVLFKDSLDFMKEEGVSLFIEVSPKITLSQIILDAIPEAKVFSSLINTNNSLDEFLGALCNVYKSGKKINFTNLYEGINLRKIPVPTYAFDRKKYWIHPSNNRTEIKENSFFYELQLEETTKFNSPNINLLNNQANIDKINMNAYLNLEVYKKYSQTLEALEHKAVNYIYQLFLDLGVPINLKLNHSELFGTYGINLKYKNLINLFLRYLCDAKLADLDNDMVELHLKAKEGEKHFRLEAGLVIDELNLVDLCGQNLKSIVTGKKNTTDLIFNKDTENFLSGFYKNSISLKLMNQLTAAFISNIYKNIPTKTGLKILEIGAGTGSTLDYLKHVLPQSNTQYLFTDVSNKFLNDAKTKFSDLTYVKYQKLDINDSFEKQGINKGSFDIVIANNVVHASKNINLTLNSVKESLANKGKLVMIEGNEPIAWIDLIFGLFDGWWHFEDFRIDYPLLENDYWWKVLKQNSFDDIQYLSPLNSFKDRGIKMMPQSLIVANVSRDIEHSNKEKWMLMGNKKLIREFRLRNSFEDIDVIEVFDGKRLADKKTSFVINYESEEDFSFLLNRYSFNKVVYFLPTYSEGEKKIESVLKGVCLPLLNLSKSLQRRGINSINIFSVIDCSKGGVNGPVNGAVYGMSKTIQAETGLGSRVLEINSSDPDHFKYIYEEVACPENDDFVFINDTRLSLKVVPKEPLDAKLSVYKNRGYVVGGAYGEIGLLVVEWLAKKGAGDIVLLGRNVPNLDVNNRIERIKLQYGVNILNYTVDISNEKEITAIFKKLKSKSINVRGIINVAGAVDDSTILNQNWDKFNNVFKAKVYGNINLFNTLNKVPLDFFIIFSSIVGIFGNAGQINHSAATSFLRYFSEFAKKQGVPITCIHWGAWADVGTLAGKTDVLDILERKGIYALNPNQIKQNFDHILGYPKNNVIYSKIDWNKFVISNEANRLLLRSIIKSDTKITPDQPRKDTPTTKSSIEDIVLYHISDILGTQVDEIDVENNLFDSGMDSLTSIQLRNSLQDAFNCTLPSNFVYLNKSPKEIALFFRGKSLFKGDKKTEFVISNDKLSKSISIQQKRWLSLTQKEYGRLLIPIIFFSNLDKTKFKNSLERVVERNSILRTIFTTEQKKKIASTNFLYDDFDNMFFDFSGYKQEKKLAEFKKVSDRIRKNPPNPYMRPSWKIACIKDTETSFVVLLFIQHLEFDGASVTQFIDQLKNEYFKLENHKNSYTASYDEYIKFQESYINSDDLKRDTTFYKEVFKHFESAPLLSLDNVEIKTISRPSKCISVSNVISLDDLQKISRDSELSLFAILTTAYAKLISNITGRKKNIIGTIMNSRPGSRFDKTIGPFVQPFPIPVDVALEDTSMVKQIHNLVLEINSRAAFPVVILIDVIKIFSELEYDTYFSDTFIMLNNYKQEKNNKLIEVVESLGEIDRGYLSGINNDLLNEIAGLFLIIDFYKNGIRFNFWYHKDRFSESQIRGWIIKYKAILKKLAHNLNKT